MSRGEDVNDHRTTDLKKKVRTVLDMNKDFWEYGKTDALASKVISPDPKRQLLLRDVVVGEVNSWHRRAFDPENNADDRRKQQCLDLLRDGRRQLWDQEQLRDDERRRDTRAVQVEGASPRISGFFFWGAVGGYAASLGPAFEPLFRADIKDGPLRWGAALGLGGLLGVVLIYGIIGIKLYRRNK